MVVKKDIRALINNIKNNSEIRNKKIFLGLINYYMGEVTEEDFAEVKNW